ncbi:MAG: pirin family protein [Pseudomonadota bacterium]
MNTPPNAADEPPPSVDLVIAPRPRDLGGFTVRRVLPYAKRRLVGPFVFFDEMGPATFAPGEGVDVRPHPHIGLATVTYLFDGALRHRDTLGKDQIIRPGDLNWMSAGRGVAHSERTDPETRAAGHKLHGLQLWAALPEADAESAPWFEHHPKDALPEIETDGARSRLIAGTAFGQVAPVRATGATYYYVTEAEAGAAVPTPADAAERAIYVVDGSVTIDGAALAEKSMAVFKTGAQPGVRAGADGARVASIGGDPFGQRVIDWNFVASDKARLEKARADWRASIDGGFDGTYFALPEGEREWIPLPGDG